MRENKVTSMENDFLIHNLAKSDFILAKQTAGRLQDLVDIEESAALAEIEPRFRSEECPTVFLGTRINARHAVC